MSATERVTVDLPSDLIAVLRAAVRSGAFASEAEAISAILSSYRAEQGTAEDDLENVRAFVAAGIADADAGHVTEAEEVYRRVRNRLLDEAN